MDWKIPLFKIYWDEDDITAVNNAIRRGMRQDYSKLGISPFGNQSLSQ